MKKNEQQESLACDDDDDWVFLLDFDPNDHLLVTVECVGDDDEDLMMATRSLQCNPSVDFHHM